ncbi:hypothetical protein MMC14_005298 [Varicellaria rhodocarpa]|nr:hypothetical protein [Varicellaria rhodocarpa]
MRTIQSTKDLAQVYKNQGRYSDAQDYLELALRESEAQRGPRHLETLQVMTELAAVYAKRNRLEDAGSLFREAFSEYEKQ